jgi:hypothetical protein
MSDADRRRMMRTREQEPTMTADRDSNTASGADRHLVDLVSAALVDPNIHTDTRMRLHEQISDVLNKAQPDLHVEPGRVLHEQKSQPSEPRLPKALESVLTDPALHTDTRMRLHREILELLRANQ